MVEKWKPTPGRDAMTRGGRRVTELSTYSTYSDSLNVVRLRGRIEGNDHFSSWTIDGVHCDMTNCENDLVTDLEAPVDHISGLEDLKTMALKNITDAYSQSIDELIRLTDKLEKAELEMERQDRENERLRDVVCELKRENERLSKVVEDLSSDIKKSFPKYVYFNVLQDDYKNLKEVLRNLVVYVEHIECQHENTHRGGVIWTICDDCGRKWADDEGGFRTYKAPKPLTDALAVLEDKI